MKFHEFEIEVIKEAGKVVIGKLRGDSLPVTVGKTTIFCDVAGMEAQFYEHLHSLETGMRNGVFVSSFPNETSTILRSDDGRHVAIVKLKAPKEFWEKRRKRLSTGELDITFRGCIRARVELKGAHFWASSHDISDIFHPESPNFEKLVFPRAQESFDQFSRQIDGFFHENAPRPESRSLTETVKDSYGAEITYDLKLTCVILDNEQGLLKAYQSWKQYLIEEPTQKTIILKPAPMTGQQGLVTGKVTT